MTSPSTSVGNGTDNDTSNASQQSTGGNGGDQLTQSNAEQRSDQPVSAPEGNRQAQPGQPDSDATASNRTAQDTRSNQAGSTGTGLGAAETGGNQDEFDMPKE